MTSGGVSSIPMTKAIRNTYGLALPSFSGVVSPVQTVRTVAIGVSKARPKASTIMVTKSRYCEMSVVISTSDGVILTKKPKTSGKTTKYAKAAPA